MVDVVVNSAKKLIEDANLCQNACNSCKENWCVADTVRSKLTSTKCDEQLGALVDRSQSAAVSWSVASGIGRPDGALTCAVSTAFDEVGAVVSFVSAGPTAAQSVWPARAFDPREAPCGGAAPRPSWFLPAVAQGHGVDVVLLLDRSGSMRDFGRFDAVRHASDAVVASLGPADRLGMILFAEQAEPVTVALIATNSDGRKSLARKVLLADAQAGVSNFKPAFTAAFNMFDKAAVTTSASCPTTSGRHALLLFVTDGGDADDEDGASVLAHVAQLQSQATRQVRVLTFSLGPAAHTDLLRQLACEHGGFSMSTADRGDLGAALTQFYQALWIPGRPALGGAQPKILTVDGMATVPVISSVHSGRLLGVVAAPAGSGEAAPPLCADLARFDTGNGSCPTDGFFFQPLAPLCGGAAADGSCQSSGGSGALFSVDEFKAIHDCGGGGLGGPNSPAQSGLIIGLGVGISLLIGAALCAFYALYTKRRRRIGSVDLDGDGIPDNEPGRPGLSSAAARLPATGGAADNDVGRRRRNGGADSGDGVANGEGGGGGPRRRRVSSRRAGQQAQAEEPAELAAPVAAPSYLPADDGIDYPNLDDINFSLPSASAPPLLGDYDGADNALPRPAARKKKGKKKKSSSSSSSAAAAAAGNTGTPDLDEEGGLCVVCFDKPKDCCLVPCGHLSVCMDCGKKLTNCCMCRQAITKRIQVFRS